MPLDRTSKCNRLTQPGKVKNRRAHMRSERNATSARPRIDHIITEVTKETSNPVSAVKNIALYAFYSFVCRYVYRKSK